MKNPKQANIFMVFFLVYVFLFQLFSPVILGIPMTLLIKLGVSEQTLTQILIIGQDLILFFIPMLLYMLFNGNKLRELIPLKPLSLSNAIYVVFITLLMMPMMSVFSSITSLFVSTEVNDTFTDMMINCSWWVSVIGIAVMPAIFEEGMFRGYILTGYKNSGFVRAALISSLFFGMMHLDLYQLPYATFAGIVFAGFVYYTGSIFASMLAHFIVNGSQTLMLILANQLVDMNQVMAEAETYTLEETISSIYTLVWMMLICLPFLIILLKKFIKRNYANCLEYRIDGVAEEGLSAYAEPEPKKCIDRYFVIVCILYIAYMLIFSI